MKKKKVIVGIVLTLLLCVSILFCWKLCAEHKKQKAEAFEAKVKEMYGERNYLGPMTKEVKPLTEEELKELNPEEEPYVKYHEHYPDNTYIYGRFNNKKIKDIYDAREAAYKALQYAGGTFDKNMLLYGEEEPNIGGNGNKEYIFQQYYKGVRLKNGKVYVRIDSNGNTRCVESIWRPEQKITMDSVEYAYQGEKLQALLEERYGECSILEKELDICQSKNGYVLEWYLVIDAPESPIDCVWLDAKTGEIWNEYVEEPIY